MVLGQQKAKKVDFGKSPMPTVIRVPTFIRKVRVVARGRQISIDITVEKFKIFKILSF